MRRLSNAAVLLLLLLRDDVSQPHVGELVAECVEELHVPSETGDDFVVELLCEVVRNGRIWNGWRRVVRHDRESGIIFVLVPLEVAAGLWKKLTETQ